MFMKIAITGASGFIGQHVVSEALSQGHSVVAISRQPKQELAAALALTADISALRITQCDLMDTQKLSQALNNCDAVIHLAASLHGKNPYQETLNSTKSLLESIQQSAINRLIAISSISVLDYIKPVPLTVIDEKTPLCTDDINLGEYARMKRDQEMLYRDWQATTNKQLATIRPGIVYSDDILSNAHAGYIKKGIGLVAMHEGDVPLIEVKQLSKQILSITTNHTISNEVFHLLGKPPVSQEDYLQQLKQQGQLRFYLPLPWRAYTLVASIIRKVLTITKKAHKIPDSFRKNSVAARQKPFRFNSAKADNLTRHH